MPINKVTGLYETWHSKLSVPIIRQRSLETLDLSGPRSAVHYVPIGPGEVLTAYADLKSAKVLAVIISSPMDQSSVEPFEMDAERFHSMDAALMTLDPLTRREKRVRGNKWHPHQLHPDLITQLLVLLEKTKQHCGAKRVLLCGAELAGDLALILSALMSDTCAYAEDPLWSQDHTYAVESNLLRLQRTVSVEEVYATLAPCNCIKVSQDIQAPREKLMSYRNFKNLYAIERAEGRDHTEKKEFLLRDSLYEDNRISKRARFHNNVEVYLNHLQSCLNK